uniref:Tautomerase cis-CaaD-like domain-containing protein n=1 Tax=Panagrolaimus sp. PS1159 TaxID=55785 RepID=A0AC35GTZ8_9BILA
MPLHRIYHTPGQFSKDDKKGLAEAITKIYTNPKGANLPAFYVVVLFVPVDEENFFVGGKTTKNFVRISVQHIARSFDSHEQSKSFLEIYESALAPFIKERGFDWEVEIEQIDRNLWRENGLSPPLPRTDAEKEWVRLNKAVPY